MCFISVSVCVFCNRVLDLKFQSIYSTKGKWRIGGLTSEIAMFLCTTYGRSGRCKAPSRLWEIFMLTAQWFHPLQFPWAGVENTSSKANEMYWSIYLSSICHLSYIHCLNSCVAVEWSGVCVVHHWMLSPLVDFREHFVGWIRPQISAAAFQPAQDGRRMGVQPPRCVSKVCQQRRHQVLLGGRLRRSRVPPLICRHL